MNRPSNLDSIPDIELNKYDVLVALILDWLKRFTNVEFKRFFYPTSVFSLQKKGVRKTINSIKLKVSVKTEKLDFYGTTLLWLYWELWSADSKTFWWVKSVIVWIIVASKRQATSEVNILSVFFESNQKYLSPNRKTINKSKISLFLILEYILKFPFLLIPYIVRINIKLWTDKL